MKANQPVPRNIDEYISGFPPQVQKILEKIRRTIRKAAPKAQEVISYQIPSFKLNGYLVHFAAYQSHIGLYPAPRGVAGFKDDLALYQTGKGTLRFPLDQPIPYELITRVVKFRVKKDLEAAEAMKKR